MYNREEWRLVHSTILMLDKKAKLMQLAQEVNDMSEGGASKQADSLNDKTLKSKYVNCIGMNTIIFHAWSLFVGEEFNKWYSLMPSVIELWN